MRRAAWLAAAALTISTALAVAPGASADTSLLQRDANQMVSAGVSSVVTRVNDRNTTTTAVAGTTQRGTTGPVSPSSHYRTGSVTKTFVSATILQLVGEGRLSLDDSVDRWLPGVITGNGNDGTKITVRELLQHTSGLFEYVEDPAFLNTIVTPEGFLANRYHHYEPHDLINLALKHPPNFAPGTGWSYSNTNYIVAGQIIRAVTGNAWDVEVTNRIIKPLGLKGTSNPGDVATLPAPFAHAYNLWSPGVYTDTTEDNMTWGGAAGALTTTTADELTFFKALLTGGVLKPAQLAQMQTTIPISAKTSYGLGIAHSKLCNTEVWWHDGGTIGYGTFVAVLPSGNLGFAFDVSTTDITDADNTFDGRVNGAQDAMIRHVFCGANTTSADSMTAEQDAVHGKPLK